MCKLQQRQETIDSIKCHHKQVLQGEKAKVVELAAKSQHLAEALYSGAMLKKC